MKAIWILPLLLLAFGLCRAEESTSTTSTAAPATTTIDPASREYVVLGNGTNVPFPLRALVDPLKEGTTIHFSGRIAPYPTVVVVNLQRGILGDKEIPFHFSNRFTEGLLAYKTIFNNLENGTWSSVEERKDNAFWPGREFDFRFRINNATHFTLYGNRKEIGLFKARKNFSDVNVATIYGDLSSLDIFHYGGVVYDSPHKFKTDFKAGTTLSLSGMPSGDEFRFRLHRNSKLDEAPLEIKFNYKEEYIGRNTWSNNTWAQEHREGGFPIKRNELIDVAFVYDQIATIFHIYVNGVKYTTYDHKMTDKPVIDTLEIMGDFTLHTSSIMPSVLKK